jgi:class 3 adenylate cyclase
MSSAIPGLIEAGEEGTLAALKAIRREVGDPRIAEHRGRIFKTTGDGLLVEFASVFDAVRCAAEIQRAMADRNVALPGERSVELRIGVHQGDIIVEDGDIFGDGVNVAARLEALAEPGGICVSARVQEDAARQARPGLQRHRRAQPEKHRPPNPGLPSDERCCCDCAGPRQLTAAGQAVGRGLTAVGSPPSVAGGHRAMRGPNIPVEFPVRRI